MSRTLKPQGSAGTKHDCHGTIVRVRNQGRNWTPIHPWTVIGPQPDGMAWGCLVVGVVEASERWNGVYPVDNNQSEFLVADGRSDRFVVKDLRWHRIWDGGRIGWDKKRSAARDVTFQDCWGTFIRDDFIEGDQGESLAVLRCLADGRASRISATARDRNFSKAVITIEDTSIWLKPHNILKIRNVTLRLKRCFFATDRVSNTPGGSPFTRALKNAMFEGVEDCTFFWLNDAPPPASPAGCTVSRDRAELEKQIADWKAAHPEVYRIPGVYQ
jgi:hypothetical protein